MKVSKSKQRGTAGIALATVLVLTAILAIGAASFGYLVQNQYKSVNRSQAWNDAMPVAESGVEEALTQLYYTGTNSPGNGWERVSDKLYRKSRAVAADGSYYTVSILLSNKPVVTSTGYVPAPVAVTNILNRTVQVKLFKSPYSRGGLTARGTITFTGGAYLDSFDSADPNYSSNGVYTVSKRKDNGLASANANIPGAISMAGGTGIYGSASTGPDGTITNSGIAKIGDIDWMNDGSQNGAQSGHVANDAHVDFPAVQAPSTSGFFTPSLGLLNGITYTYLLTSGKYYTSSKMQLNSGEIMTVSGDVTLYVDNDFSVAGQAYINILPGASLKLYVSKSLSIGGGGIVNGSQDASKLSIYGLNNSIQTWSYTGNSAFIGTMYAPNANLTFAGTSGASGAFTANNITVSGSAGVHYDENLVGGRKGYVVASWNEL
jgi:hypothetical protein